MNLGGYIFITLFWGLVLGLNIFCYTKLLKKNGKSSQS